MSLKALERVCVCERVRVMTKPGCLVLHILSAVK